jgi:GT2 family glycosyltransferase
VLLNNDVRLSRGFLAGLAEACQASPAGLIAPAYDRNWPQQRTGYSGPADHYRPAEREHPVPFADGTCLAVPHQTLRRAGLLDERSWPRYGWGCDKDYALRVRQAGGEVRVTERAYLNHLGRRTAATAPWYDEAEAEAENNAGMTVKWGQDWRDLLYAGFDAVPRAGLAQERLARAGS